MCFIFYLHLQWTTFLDRVLAGNMFNMLLQAFLTCRSWAQRSTAIMAILRISFLLYLSYLRLFSLPLMYYCMVTLYKYSIKVDLVHLYLIGGLRSYCVLHWHFCLVRFYLERFMVLIVLKVNFLLLYLFLIISLRISYNAFLIVFIPP